MSRESLESRESRESRESLDIRDGRFILKNPSRASMRVIRGNSYWKRAGESYETTSLGAAAKFRSVASEKVERVFKRTFQEFYDKPVLSELAPGLVQHLDGHQRVGIRWVLSRKRSYLAHAPGAGKTAQAILAGCLSQGKGQVVFIVPPSLVKNWEREIWKFTEWLGAFPTIGIVGRTQDAHRMAWRADFLIIPDSMLPALWVYQRLEKLKIKLLAVDEASRFKEPTALRSIALFGGQIRTERYGGIFRGARHVVLMDGSPMLNRPIELWAPVYAMDPQAISCMSYDDFGYRYCGARPNARGQWEYKFSSNEAELKEKLQRSFMHVVPESALSHPERRRSILVMTDDVRGREHREWERRQPRELRDLHQGISEERVQGEMARFRRELGIRKVPWVAGYVRERLERTGESILLFAWHRDVIDALAEALKEFEPGVVMGGTDALTRERAFILFQKGRMKLLIMNIAAGGRGHNLQRADRVIFAEYSWTDELNKQCEKRASRRGNEKAFVRCEYIVCPDSMDEVVLQSLFTKERRVRKVIGG